MKNPSLDTMLSFIINSFYKLDKDVLLYLTVNLPLFGILVWMITLCIKG